MISSVGNLRLAVKPHPLGLFAYYLMEGARPNAATPRGGDIFNHESIELGPAISTPFIQAINHPYDLVVEKD